MQTILYELTGDSKYESAINNFIDYMLNTEVKTPQGLLYIDSWGTCRHAANVAHVFFQISALGIRSDELETFAEGQINYMLGENNNNFSYMIGFGDSHPMSPHHRSSSCYDQPSTCDWANYDMPEPNPQTLYGALVGGPDQNDNYVDDRHDYTHNEVATDYNAGFQSALIALVNKYY